MMRIYKMEISLIISILKDYKYLFQEKGKVILSLFPKILEMASFGIILIIGIMELYLLYTVI
jgi:hypothetical protein